MAFDEATRRRIERAWNCRLHTRGRKSGQRRSVTVWFALDGDEVVVCGSPENPQWRRNLQACGDLELEIAGVRMRGRAHAVDDEADAEAIRQLFVRRYLAVRLSRPFGGYTRATAVRIAIDEVDAG